MKGERRWEGGEKERGRREGVEGDVEGRDGGRGEERES